MAIDDLVREDPTHVINHDLVMVHNMCNRFIREVQFSQSSNVSGLLASDQTRVVSYISALNTLKDWIVSQPTLDLPETHPRPYALEPRVTLKDTESESVAMLINLVRALDTEMLNSQSARLPSGLIHHDQFRFEALTAKMASFITDYVATATPLDLPESAPDEAITGHGQGGIGA